jgi:hypothetical protein
MERTMNARTWMLAPALAFVAAGCADSITTPDAPAAPVGGAAFSHTYTEGNTVKGHWAPEVETQVVDGDRVELCATWIDFSNFEPSDPHVYSFDVDLDVDGSWLPLGSAGGQGSGPEACFTTDPMDDGTYTFRVKGMANVPTGGTPPFSPHHTDFWTGEVTVGEEFRFEAYLRAAPDGWVESGGFNASAGTWNFQFMLKVWNGTEFEAVESCDEWPSVSLAWGSESATVTIEDCGYNGAMGAAKFDATVSNPDQGSAMSGTIVFVLNGSENENEVTFSSSAPGGSGGGGPQSQGGGRQGR